MNDELSDAPLNDLAWNLVHQLLAEVDNLRIDPVEADEGAVLLDFGVEAPGSLGAGLALAEVCMAGLCQLSIVPGSLHGTTWPSLFVQTDNPLEACLFSQYAGWKLSTDNYFAMGSGPMRAAYGKEPLFEKYEYRESGPGVVGILESSQLPPREVIREIAEACHVPPHQVALLVAPTASLAGNMQIVARSVETALHKLFEMGFDLEQIECASGVAPISPVAADDLSAIGRTNDAILYGGRVTLWVNGSDAAISEVGPGVPSKSSPSYGKPFLELFEEADRDFYNMDPQLFSPAEVVFQNVETGRVHRFGQVNEPLLGASFGLT